MIIRAVLDEDEYFYDQCYNDIRVVIVTKWRHFVFYLHMRSLDLQPISWYFFSQLQKFQYMKFMNQFNDQLPVVAIDDPLTFISSSCNFNIWNWHNSFFPGYIINQFNDHLPVVLPSQLVRAPHRYLKGQGSNPGKSGSLWLRWSSLHRYVTATTTNTYVIAKTSRA